VNLSEKELIALLMHYARELAAANDGIARQVLDESRCNTTGVPARKEWIKERVARMSQIVAELP